MEEPPSSLCLRKVCLWEIDLLERELVEPHTGS